MKHIQKRFLLFAVAAVSTLLPAVAQNLEEQTIDSLATSNEEVQVAFRKVAEGNILGGVSVVNVEELTKKNYNTYSIDNMQGYIGGWNGNSLWAMDEYLAMVDGVPRDLNNVKPDEIETITFLKGAQAVVLYGSRAAKGVVLVTTKRGKISPLKVDVRANTGWSVLKAYPEYLGSAEYMTLYNEALANDGLAAKYNAEEIYNYGLGTNSYRYSNLNFYSSDFIKKAYNRSDVTAEISGGNERARFYTNVSYNNEGSPLNFGEAKKTRADRFNVRGNVDLKLNDFITAYVNGNVSFYNANASAGGNYWQLASTFRPNRVSPLVPLSAIDSNATAAWELIANSNNIIDGQYFLGGTQEDLTNVFADYYAAGKTKYTSRQFQFDAGVNIDLEKVLKGLSFHTQFAVDYATSYNTSYDNEYATYIPTWSNYNGQDVIVGLKKSDTNDKKSGVQNISGSASNQTIAFNAHFDYNRTFNNSHNVSAIFVANGYQQSKSKEYHSTSNVNLGLQASYNYEQKYFAEFGGSVIHSAKLAEGHRQAFSPSISLGWNMAKESFMEDSAFDKLMLNVSGSILHTDLGINDYYMYAKSFNQSDGSWWGWYDGQSIHATNSKRGENLDLTFLKRKEFSANIKASLWNKMLTADASFFMNTIEGKLITPNNLFPSYFFTYWPEATFLPHINYDNDKRVGFDFALNYNKRFGEVDFSAGVSGTYYTTKASKRDDSGFADAYQNRQGKAIDGIWGYECLGFFESPEDVANSPEQKLGGTVKQGDLKYKDQNGDEVIDSKDQIYLGRGGWYGNPLTLGVNLTAKYKGFTLFVLGTGGFGGKAIKNDAEDTNYWWISGQDKYSKEVRGRWTPATAATATYPRLTTEGGANNFTNSDFWIYSTNRFNLAKVQLTYDFPTKMLRKTIINGLSAYISGSNLLTIAKEREILEMNVGTAPQTRFYNLGVKVTF